MALRSVDHEFRGKSYRLREPERSDGASVRAAEQQTVCGVCDRVIRQYGIHVLVRKPVAYHPACAISTGVLEALDAEADRAWSRVAAEDGR